MDLDYLIQEHIVFGITHEHKERIAEVEKFAWQVMTGKDQDDIVISFRPNETDKQKKQRVNLYVPLTKYVSSRFRKYWKKLERTEGVKITVESTDKKKLEDLNDNFSNFYGGRSLEEYLHWRLEYCNFFKPDSYSVYERFDLRNESGEITKTTVYPILIESKNVINAIKENGDLKVLFTEYPRVEMELKKNNQPKRITLTDYVAYMAGVTIEYREFSSEKKANEAKGDGELIAIKDFNNKHRIFVRFEYDTGTTEIPAITNGAYKDEQTTQETNVTPFEPATDVYVDLIKNKSFLDVAVHTHVFFKKFVYVKPCTFSDDSGVCKGGFINGVHGNTCPVCHGSGKAPVHTTDQEVIEMALPETADELMELSKMSHYEIPPMDIPDFVHKLVLEAEQRTFKAVFNEEMLEKVQIAKTATEIDRVYEERYDVLKPFFNLVAAHFEKAHRLKAQYTEMTDFFVSYQPPNDYKMKTVNELLVELGLINQNGGGYDAAKAVRKDILQKQHANNPTEIMRIEARERWRPLSDKPQELAAMIIAGLNPKDFHRVLFEHFKEIFEEVEAAHPEFFRYDYEKQKSVLEAIVLEFAEKRKPVIEPLNTGNFE